MRFLLKDYEERTDSLDVSVMEIPNYRGASISVVKAYIIETHVPKEMRNKLLLTRTFTAKTRIP
jgi:phage head maturation protease